MLAIAAGLPIIGEAVRDVSEQWVPLGDDALTAIRALDVLTLDTPVAGLGSSGASAALGEPVDSPGPMLFWLLALPVRLPDARALPLSMAIVNLGCLAGSLVLARRRGGVGLMFALAIAVALMLGSLPADVYTDIWNSSSPLMPLVLSVMLAWSVGAGEYRLLPLAALVWSFVFQSHVVFVAPIACLALGAVALLACSCVAVVTRASRDLGSAPRLRFSVSAGACPSQTSSLTTAATRRRSSVPLRRTSPGSVPTRA